VTEPLTEPVTEPDGVIRLLPEGNGVADGGAEAVPLPLAAVEREAEALLACAAIEKEPDVARTVRFPSGVAWRV
jgi:hypothetical protein